MIAVDTQILIYAHNKDSPWHESARDRLAELASSPIRWAIPMHCLTEFYAKVTRRGPYVRASSPEQAIAQIDVWLSAPRISVLDENSRTWLVLRDLLQAARTTGPRAYDARIAAVCIQNGVTELWTNDRDYLAFPALRVRNPLVDIQPTGAKEPRVAYQTRTTAPGRRRRPRQASLRK